MAVQEREAQTRDNYRWVALTNTTAAVFMSALDGSIVIISLPAIFRGIHLDPLAPANIVYLLWMIMGYRLVQSVLVVTLGRIGDMYGRVRVYNFGFTVFTVASILLSFDPFDGSAAAQWLIGWRLLQAVGGSMLTANSAAILTDAFPPDRRGFALGFNQVAALAGQFIGLVAGGLLAAWDWRAVFWVNVPVGVFGTIWAYRRLRDNGERHRGRIDWWGNITFAVGLSAVLDRDHHWDPAPRRAHHGWHNPFVLGTLALRRRPAGRLRPHRVAGGGADDPAEPVQDSGVQRRQRRHLRGGARPGRTAVHAHHLATGHLAAAARLRLRRHPAVGGHLHVAADGRVPDRRACRGRALRPVRGPRDRVGRHGVVRAQLRRPAAAADRLPVLGLRRADRAQRDWQRHVRRTQHLGHHGQRAAQQRGVASGMRATFQNSGTALSIGVFFSLMVVGLAGSLPGALSSGLTQHGVPHDVAPQVSVLPPVSTLFAAVLGVNPLEHLLAPSGVLTQLPPASQAAITGRDFFPNLISGPFHDGLTVVFGASIALAVLAAIASLARGRVKR